jgi:hypothetical protein
MGLEENGEPVKDIDLPQFTNKRPHIYPYTVIPQQMVLIHTHLWCRKS